VIGPFSPGRAGPGRTSCPNRFLFISAFPSGADLTHRVAAAHTRPMATWRDVERIASGLAGAHRGAAPDGAPSYDIGRHPFARLRRDDAGREIVQLWTMEPDTAAMYADRRDTFVRVDTFKVKASLWALLERLDEQELAELVTDSWLARRGVRG